MKAVVYHDDAIIRVVPADRRKKTEPFLLLYKTEKPYLVIWCISCLAFVKYRNSMFSAHVYLCIACFPLLKAKGFDFYNPTTTASTLLTVIDACADPAREKVKVLLVKTVASMPVTEVKPPPLLCF